MEQYTTRTNGFSGITAKIDMSLDDIIRLNKKQIKRPASKKGTMNRKFQSKGTLPQGKRPGSSSSMPGGKTQRGDMTRLGMRGHKVPPPMKRRRAQGVITGLAARKSATFFKGISPLDRPFVDQKTKPFVYGLQRRRTTLQRQPYRHTEAPKPPPILSHKPDQLSRIWPAIHQGQREARQATFFSRRGLKVQAAISKTSAAPVVQKRRPWRTPSRTNGILTVCIGNPSARTQPEPARAWSLHPQSTHAVEVKKQKMEAEKKSPKGVALQFDINSVGKQTAMTLNERFRILKERRTAAATSTKGSRYVTVG